MAPRGRKFIIGLIFISIGLGALIIYPFASAIFLGCVLAGALYPLCTRLTRRLRNRRQLAAGLLTAAVVLALILPLAAISALAVAEVINGVQFVRSTLESGGAQGLIMKLPAWLQSLAHYLLELFTKGEMQLRELTSQQGGKAAAAVGAVLQFTGEALLQTVMMLIALFFLLVDGQKLVEWLGRISPLRPGHTRELLTEFRTVAVAVLVSSVVTAAIQAIAALVGYLIARVPNPFFFTLATFLFAFVPAVGAGAVALTVALLLVVSGHPIAAGFLAIWGLVVVGLVDNIAKPLLIKGDVQMHGAVVFFALLGGLAVFGLVGLIAGPLIVSFFVTLTRIYERDYKDSPVTGIG